MFSPKINIIFEYNIYLEEIMVRSIHKDFKYAYQHTYVTLHCFLSPCLKQGERKNGMAVM